VSLYSSIQRSACSLEIPIILLLRRIVSAITVIGTESCDTFTLNLLRLLSSDTTHIGIVFSVRTSVSARQYLLSVICNSNSFQSILFKLCTVFVYILKMCTYYGLIWRFFSYIFCMLNLVIFYHYMSWTVPSWCNLKLQQCSINIIQTLHSVGIHIEDVHLLLWADLKIFSYILCVLNLVIFYHYMSWTVPSWCFRLHQLGTVNVI
jgi:hypothetical protein